MRAAVLALLAEGPQTGYEIIQQVEERSGGVWRPSAGSVYPVLQQLEDEGLARPVPGSGRRKVVELTDEGRAHLEAHPEQTEAPWDAVRATVDDEAVEVRDLVRQVAVAAGQVQEAGTARQAAEMRRILAETRRSLYRILAEDEDEDEAADDSVEATGDAPEDAAGPTDAQDT